MKNLLGIEDADLHPVEFPKTHHLVVTTSKGVQYWTSEGIRDVFHSGSKGIVAAKKSRDASGVIAVADSQVVVLHDTGRALEKSYRLKGTDVCILLVSHIASNFINYSLSLKRRTSRYHPLLWILLFSPYVSVHSLEQ